MPTIPALTSISGEVSAAPHNNNYGAIRTYVNSYCGFIDTTNTWALQQTFSSGIVVSSGTAALPATTCTTLSATTSITCTNGTTANILAQTTGGTIAAKIYADGSNSWGGIGTFTNHNLVLVTNSIVRGRITSGGNVEFDNNLTVTGTTTLGAVTSGAITATGNSTITGTLGGVTTLTCTTVTATNLGGTLTTAAQANVTSLGTLTALTVSGVTILRLTGGGAKIAEAASTGNLWVGPQSAVTTSATAGMLIMPGCNGTPTGSFSLGTNGFPMVIDYNTSKIWVNFNGTWRATAALT